MSDGFSGPNPADTGDETHDDEIPGLDEMFDGDMDDLIIADEDVSCVNCSHFTVCQIFQRFAQQMQEYEGREDADPPIDVTHLAVICDEYEREE